MFCSSNFEFLEFFSLSEIQKSTNPKISFFGNSIFVSIFEFFGFSEIQNPTVFEFSGFQKFQNLKVQEFSNFRVFGNSRIQNLSNFRIVGFSELLWLLLLCSCVAMLRCCFDVPVIDILDMLLLVLLLLPLLLLWLLLLLLQFAVVTVAPAFRVVFSCPASSLIVP